MPLFNFIKSNLSILDVISEYVQLNPIGSYWKGPCPFHSEKEASFTVSPDKQIFYCFGCQAGGDLISFIAKKENLSQFEAVKFLIDKYQLSIPEDILKGATKQIEFLTVNKKTYFDLCKSVADWARDRLFNSTSAMNYLEKRSIDLKQIEYFNIGYFAGGLKNINHLLKVISKNGFLAKDLIDAGILIAKGTILYSPFEERILFPIKNGLGRYCGFGGRIFKENDNRAKYYNSRENKWFTKGELLFGLDLAKNIMKEKKSAFLVEGYTDCVAMIKHGHLNTVATLGTACTQKHLKILSRCINTLFVLYDGDAAGQKAILRLTQLCWNVDLQLKILKLPFKEDPASFLNKGANLRDMIKNAKDIFSFFVESMGDNFFSSSFSKRLKISEEIVQLILMLKDPFKQELLLQQASTILQLPVSALKDLMKDSKIVKMVKKKQKHPEIENIKNSSVKPKNLDNLDNSVIKVSLLEERIFSAIINNVGKGTKLYIDTDLLSYFSEYVQYLLKLLYDFIVKNGENEGIFNDFLNSLNSSDKQWVIANSLKFEQKITEKEVFDELVFHFCKQNWKKIVGDIKIKLSKARLANDAKRFNELFNLFSSLKKGIHDRGLI